MSKRKDTVTIQLGRVAPSPSDPPNTDPIEVTSAILSPYGVDLVIHQYRSEADEKAGEDCEQDLVGLRPEEMSRLVTAWLEYNNRRRQQSE